MSEQRKEWDDLVQKAKELGLDEPKLLPAKWRMHNLMIVIGDWSVSGEDLREIIHKSRCFLSGAEVSHKKGSLDLSFSKSACQSVMRQNGEGGPGDHVEIARAVLHLIDYLEKKND